MKTIILDLRLFKIKWFSSRFLFVSPSLTLKHYFSEKEVEIKFKTLHNGNDTKCSFVEIHQ